MRAIGEHKYLQCEQMIDQTLARGGIRKDRRRMTETESELLVGNKRKKKERVSVMFTRSTLTHLQWREVQRRLYVKDTVFRTYIPQSTVGVAGYVGRNAPAWQCAVDGRVDAI